VLVHASAYSRPGTRRSSEQERFLFCQRDSDEHAREQLIREKMPLGLIKAVDRFDPDRGTAFASFAVPTITGEIRRHIRDTAWAAHVTRDMQEASMDVVRAADSLTSSLGRSPTVAEIAEATGRSREGVVEALETAKALDADSLDAPAADGGAVDRYDEVGARDEELEQAESRATARSVVQRLPQQERLLLTMRFDEGLTQRQIGRRIGVSQMHVSRLLRRALERASILAEA
jgi:RNA polymerase sigma-B factor